MLALSWVLTVTSLLTLGFVQYRYVLEGSPKGKRWKIGLFLSGWLAGAFITWTIMGAPKGQAFAAAFAFGLPMGYIAMKWLPITVRLAAEESERNRRKRQDE